MNGPEVLKETAALLERIDPDDRYCPFCRALLAIIRPHISRNDEAAQPRVLDQ